MYVHYFVGQLRPPVVVLAVDLQPYDAYNIGGMRTINFTASDRCWMVPGTVDPMED